MESINKCSARNLMVFIIMCSHYLYSGIIDDQQMNMLNRIIFLVKVCRKKSINSSCLKELDECTNWILLNWRSIVTTNSITWIVHQVIK